MDSIVSFPQYRRLINGKSYYRIDSPSSMLEISVMGSNWWELHLQAKILPERLLIQDILGKEDGRWEEVSQVEFDDFLLELRRTKTKRDI